VLYYSSPKSCLAHAVDRFVNIGGATVTRW